MYSVYGDSIYSPLPHSLSNTAPCPIPPRISPASPGRREALGARREKKKLIFLAYFLAKSVVLKIRLRAQAGEAPRAQRVVKKQQFFCFSPTFLAFFVF